MIFHSHPLPTPFNHHTRIMISNRIHPSSSSFTLKLYNHFLTFQYLHHNSTKSFPTTILYHQNLNFISPTTIHSSLSPFILNHHPPSLIIHLPILNFTHLQSSAQFHTIDTNPFLPQNHLYSTRDTRQNGHPKPSLNYKTKSNQNHQSNKVKRHFPANKKNQPPNS